MKIFGLMVISRRRYERDIADWLDAGLTAGRLEARYGARGLAVVNGVWGSRPEAAWPGPRGGQHRRRRGHLRLVTD